MLWTSERYMACNIGEDKWFVYSVVDDLDEFLFFLGLLKLKVFSTN